MSGPAPKRRRLSDPNGDAGFAGETSMVTLIHRRDEDLRASLQHLYAALDKYGDVTICVHGEKSEQEFCCIASLLASASRPLGAMLFGPMCATTQEDGQRKYLHLRMTEPKHFHNLLRHIHGQDIRARHPRP